MGQDSTWHMSKFVGFSRHPVLRICTGVAVTRLTALQVLKSQMTIIILPLTLEFSRSSSF